jgi:hypothetical protein
MGLLKEFLTALLFDARPEDRARLVRFSFRLFITCYVAWAIGAFSAFGFNGVARAGEIDDKIQAAVAPIRAEVQAVSTQISSQDEVLKEIRMEQIASQLRDLQTLRCKSDSDGRERMDAEIEVAERKYRALSGDRYPLPPCEPKP